jgi:hypothetical protein
MITIGAADTSQRRKLPSQAAEHVSKIAGLTVQNLHGAADTNQRRKLPSQAAEHVSKIAGLTVQNLHGAADTSQKRRQFTSGH